VTKLLASEGSTAGTYVGGGTPEFAAFDGTYLWISRYSNTIVRLLPSDGSTTDYDLGIGRGWGVAANNVSKINAGTGAVVGTYPVGPVPFFLAFDGINMWVANGSGTTVTELKASDRSLVSTYTLGNSPVGVVFRRNQYLGDESVQ